MTYKQLSIALLSLALAACGGGEEPVAGPVTSEPAAATETETSATEPIVLTECVNDLEGYAIAYPKGWRTDALAPAQECAFFDPERFELVRGSEFPPTALEARWVGKHKDYADVAERFADERFETVRTFEEVEAAGRPAVRIETVATGRGLYDRGTVTYGYVLQPPSGGAFLVRTTVLPGASAEAAKPIVDDAVETLRFFPPQVAYEEPKEPEEPVGEMLPAAVERTRAAIAAAASARDDEALERLVPRSGFTYTYGDGVPGGPVAYWRDLEESGEDDPLRTLAALLELPYTKSRGIYVWPFAYDRDPSTLTLEERRALTSVHTRKELAQFAQLGHYLGWRAGIRHDGTWVFYVAGD